MSYRGRGGGRDRRFDVKQRLRDKLQSQQNASSSEFTADSSHRNPDRHPPGLRGRDVGMWYRDRAREKKRERGETSSERRKVS